MGSCGAIAEMVEGAADGGVGGGDAVEDFAEVGGEDEEWLVGDELRRERREGGFRCGTVLGCLGGRI